MFTCLDDQMFRCLGDEIFGLLFSSGPITFNCYLSHFWLFLSNILQSLWGRQVVAIVGDGPVLVLHQPSGLVDAFVPAGKFEVWRKIDLCRININTFDQLAVWKVSIRCVKLPPDVVKYDHMLCILRTSSWCCSWSSWVSLQSAEMFIKVRHLFTGRFVSADCGSHWLGDVSDRRQVFSRGRQQSESVRPRPKSVQHQLHRVWAQHVYADLHPLPGHPHTQVI